MRFLLAGDAGELLFGEPRDRSAEPQPDAAADPAELGIIDDDGDGIPESIGEFRASRTGPGVRARDPARLREPDRRPRSGPGRNHGTVPGPGRAGSTAISRTTKTRDVLVDLGFGPGMPPGRRTRDRSGTSSAMTTGCSLPGWVAVTGVNQLRRCADRTKRFGDPSSACSSGTSCSPSASIVFSFGFGLILALALQHERVRGRTFYRSIYIMPVRDPRSAQHAHLGRPAQHAVRGRSTTSWPSSESNGCHG